jgi:HemY protein
MRWIVWVLLILSVAVGVALLMRFNHGNIAVFWPPYRVDVSVNFAVLVVGLAFLVAHLLLVGLSKALDLPTRVREYRARRTRDGAIGSLRDSLLAYFEGRFGRAERLAQQVREDPELAGPAALVAARAAHRMREFERRDRWLANAEGELHSGHAYLMTAAELAVEDQDPARALTMIGALHGRGARHIHSLRLALRAHEQNEDWPKVLQVLRQLEKRDALHPTAIRGLKVRAMRALFAQRSGDLTGLRDLYGSLPSDDRQLPEVIEVAAEAFAQSGDEEQAWRMIEIALRERLSNGLLRLYGRLRSIPARERLMRAERWREKYGDDPALMLTLGRLCMDESLWGKAEEFLNLALSATDPAAAHFALAELYEKIGRTDDAADHFRTAAVRAFGPNAGARRSTDVRPQR